MLTLASSKRVVSTISTSSLVGCTPESSRKPEATARSFGSKHLRLSQGAEEVFAGLDQITQRHRFDQGEALRGIALLHHAVLADAPGSAFGTNGDRRTAFAQHRIALLRDQFTACGDAEVAGPGHIVLVAFADEKEPIALNGHVRGAASALLSPGRKVGLGFLQAHAAAQVVDRAGAGRGEPLLGRFAVARPGGCSTRA